jgi:hypothetical protein
MGDDELELLKKPPTAWETCPEPTETPEERFNTLSSFCGTAHTPATAEVKERIKANTSLAC